MPKGISRLPNELIIDIINKLATPIHELAYLHPPLVLATLLNLALVSHAVSTWSIPFIYNRIVITTPKQLQGLHQSICHRPAEQRPSVEAFAIVPSHNDYDYELNPETAQQIHDLFDAMKHSLQRLTIDLPLRGLDPEDLHEEMNIRTPIREALSRLSHISEFVSIQDELFIGRRDRSYSVWPTWTSLRRLALYNPDVTLELENGLKALPHMEHLVLVRHDDEVLIDLIRRSSTLKVVALINPWYPDLVAVSPVFQERGDIKFDLHLPEYERHVDPIMATQNWYRTQTLLGTLWKGKDSWEPVFLDSETDDSDS